MQNVLSKTALLSVLVGLAACSGGGANVSTSAQPSSSMGSFPAARASVVAPARAAYAQTVQPDENIALAIDAGGGAVDNWVADTDYSGGSVVTVNNNIDTSHVSNPAPEAVYQSQRYGADLSYTIPQLIPKGSYSVRLEFAESFWTGPGDRLFNVTINGTQVLSNFDIFKAAGGENIAIAETFATNADASGNITIGFAATRNEATIAGIAILESGNSTPSPSPSHGDVMPWVYSELWSSSSPFKTTVAAQKANGATVVPHQYMDSLWNQGIAGNGTAQGIPIYVASSTDPLLTAVCTLYGGNCNAKNVRIHVPTYATAQQSPDGHIVIIDENSPNGKIEIDCWQASISGGNFQCSWAGAYKLGTSGVSEDGSEGIHGGMAVSTVYISGQELVNGHIDHALGMATSCLNNATIYPADTSIGTDTSCDNTVNPPHYGNLVHLLWSATQIENSAYSAPCKVVLTALATYGAYLDDTGNNGLQVNVQNELSYTANPRTKSLDPWPGIQSVLNAGGDGTQENWWSCFNRVQSSDFELIEMPQP
jgi:hypothetical protein